MKSKKEGSFVDRGSEYEPSLTVYGILQTHALSFTPLFANQEIKKNAGTKPEPTQNPPTEPVGTWQTSGHTVGTYAVQAAAVAKAKQEQQSSVTGTDTVSPQVGQREVQLPPDDKESEKSRIEPEIAELKGDREIVAEQIQQSSLEESRIKPEITVYVSCLIRTWMTAILLYQTYETIHLIIAPYLKEEGDTAGNLPLPLREQIHKMNEFLKYVDFLKLNKPKTIYLKIAPFDARQEPVLLHTFSDASTENDVYASFEYTCDISKYISKKCPSSRLSRSYKTEIAHNWQKTQNLLKHVRLNSKKKEDVDVKQIKEDYKDYIEILKTKLRFEENIEENKDKLSFEKETKQTETSSAEENLYLKVDLQQFIQWASSTEKTNGGLYDIRAVAHGKMMRKFFSPGEELKKKLKHENSWSIDYDVKTTTMTIHHGIRQPDKDQVSKYIRSSCEPLCLFSYGNYAPQKGYVWDDDKARITRCSDKMLKSKSGGGSQKTSLKSRRRRSTIQKNTRRVGTVIR